MVNAPSKIRVLRTAIGMSREALAARVGLSVTWLATVEREPGFLSPVVARRLAAVLGVRPDDLMGARGTPRPGRRRAL